MLELAHSRQRWANFKHALGERLVFAWRALSLTLTCLVEHKTHNIFNTINSNKESIGSKPGGDPQPQVSANILHRFV